MKMERNEIKEANRKAMPGFLLLALVGAGAVYHCGIEQFCSLFDALQRCWDFLHLLGAICYFGGSADLEPWNLDLYFSDLIGCGLDAAAPEVCSRLSAGISGGVRFWRDDGRPCTVDQQAAAFSDAAGSIFFYQLCSADPWHCSFKLLQAANYPHRSFSARVGGYFE